MSRNQKSTPKESPHLDRYLDEVAAHLGRHRGRRDLMMELRSTILDRAEEFAGGPPDDADVKRAIAAAGDPAVVASAYAGERYLIGPQLYRPFLVYTGIVFAVHLVMILIATVTMVRFEMFPVTILRVAPPYTLLNLFLTAAHALLLDIGLMVVIFVGISRASRTVRLPRFAFRVGVATRPAVGRIVLAVLILLILNFLRDRLFVALIPDPANPGATMPHPLFNATFAASLPLINAFLALMIAREIAYKSIGERRGVLIADTVISILGVALMVWLITRFPLFSLPPESPGPLDALPTMNRFMNKAGELILIVFAAGFGVAAAKRLVRLGQIWR